MRKTEHKPFACSNNVKLNNYPLVQEQKKNHKYLKEGKSFSRKRCNNRRHKNRNVTGT